MRDAMVPGCDAGVKEAELPADASRDPSAARRGRGPSTEEIAVINRAKAGDRDAFRLLYQRYARDVERVAASILRDPHEAEDITHNVFLKLIEAIRNYEPGAVPFSAWLTRVARNAALDHLRTRRAVPLLDEYDAGHDDLELDVHRSDVLRAALDELPAMQREILFLRHVAGLSPGEIAIRLDRTEASVHGLHHRGRAALRTILGRQENGPITRVGLGRAAA
jgi:RNA polymerase sigma-70 factor, ECF subfamily